MNTLKFIFCFVVSACLAVAGGGNWSLPHQNSGVDKSKSNVIQTKQQEKAQGSEKQESEKTNKPTQKPEAQTSKLAFYETAREKLVTQLMRSVHRGKGAPLVVFEKLIKQKNAKPDWESLVEKAKLVQIMGMALETPESNSSKNPREKGYVEGAKMILEATKKKKFEALKAGV